MRKVFHIADDANYSEPVFLFRLRREGETVADGALARPVALGHCAIDERDRLRVLPITGVTEESPGDERHANRAEVVGRNEMVSRRRPVVRREGFAYDGESPYVFIIARPRQIGCQSYRLRAQQGGEPFEQSLLKRGDLCWIAVSRAR